MSSVTHIITATIDFEGYDEAEKRMISVVKPEWVDECVSKRKLANTRSWSPDPRLFFLGLVVCIADLPDGDKDAIIGGVVAMGGLYAGSLSKLVTHIVALDMSSQTCQIALSKGLSCKIVLPHWFDDCLRLGRRIAEGPYLLPDPEVLMLRPYQGVSRVARPDLKTDTVVPDGQLAELETNQSETRQEPQIFQGKTLLLSNDLGISSHLRNAIESILRASGGQIASQVSDADVVVCQYREEPDFCSALSQGKTVGSLTWLYHVMTRNAWASPLQRLLHYPVPRDGVPGFNQFRISLSNYSGDARTYLESLAKAAGCEFTKTMKTDNTHLITAHPQSEKCDAAREWNVHIVNHLWLEESYARCQVQSVANPRYTHWPPRTNLGEVVGQTPMESVSLSPHVYPSESTKRKLGCADEKSSPPADEAATEECKAHTPVPSKAVVRAKKALGLHVMSPNAEVLSSPRLAYAATPVRRVFRPDGKENETPSTAGSRGAKEKAAARIHGLAPDIALYEKERKRVGGVVFGGRPSKEELVPQQKQKQSPKASESKRAESEDGVPKPKRAKKTMEPIKMHLLVTGYTKWTEDDKAFRRAKVTISSSFSSITANWNKDQLRALGIVVTPDPLKCSHLAAPKLLRTPKFICAMSRAPEVLDISFVEDCLRENKLLESEEYSLEDVEGEERYSMRLPQATERARSNKGKLLRGQRIFVSDEINGGFEPYKSIIEANGGDFQLFRPRSTNPNVEERRDVTTRDREALYLISREDSAQAKLWPRFRQMAEAMGRPALIVNPDWLLDMALSQQIRAINEYEVPAST